MYRHSIRQQVRYGQFREYMELAGVVIAARDKLGLTSASLWAPMVGAANEVVWELYYPDLATFERENEAFYADGDAMKAWRDLWQLTVEGSTRDELLQEAPNIA
jgi:hypothetical protein